MGLLLFSHHVELTLLEDSLLTAEVVLVQRCVGRPSDGPSHAFTKQVLARTTLTLLHLSYYACAYRALTCDNLQQEVGAGW